MGIKKRGDCRINSFFDIQAVDREVEWWQQPLLRINKVEYCILVFYLFEGNIAKFYLKGYPEIGFIDHVELGPAHQTGDGFLKIKEKNIEIILENIDIICQMTKSDEGGGVYHNTCKYIFGQWKTSID
ncbi:NDP-hexose 2,3-dehydratase family protein [Candidatus Neomarinimicrobiota bacterium]